jgi:pyrroloquinoline quinone biosynthesis protein B
VRFCPFLLIGLIYLLGGCNSRKNTTPELKSPALITLGVAQDAGYPQMGCLKDCCKKILANPELKKFVTSLALIDPANKKWWLFEATPDIKEQLQLFRKMTDSAYNFLPDGIFLTHGHIGHYTGLMQLGREVMNTNKLPVYVMPRMKTYLSSNGPWSQLVSLNNISLIDLNADSAIGLTNEISVTAFTVPHRDEFTETVGFSIKVNAYETLFIPDIDKWNKFDQDIKELVKKSNLALLDGTFYKDGELTGRAMSEVPHPFIEESIQYFADMPAAEKKKISFIHFNHTNPLLDERSDELSNVLNKGFMVSRQAELIILK